MKADFYPAGDDVLHEWALSNVHQIDVAGERVRLAPPEYVIIRKLEYFRDGGSDRHLRDVRAMLRIAENPIDIAMVVAQVERLGLESQWELARKGE